MIIIIILPIFFPGGNTSLDDDPRADGDDGTSFFGPDGEPYVYPLKGNVMKKRMSTFKTQTNVSLLETSIGNF